MGQRHIPCLPQVHVREEARERGGERENYNEYIMLHVDLSIAFFNTLVCAVFFLVILVRRTSGRV